MEQLWHDAVHGEQSARQRYGRKQKTLHPERRDSLWYGDGTKLNLYYRDGNTVRTTSVYEVVDDMSEVLLGYCISESENFEAQYCAFRMAIERSGHKPYEIVHDNQGGHKKLNRKARSLRGTAKRHKVFLTGFATYTARRCRTMASRRPLKAFLADFKVRYWLATSTLRVRT